MHDRKEYVIHIRNLKQLLNHGLFSEKSSINSVKNHGSNSILIWIQCFKKSKEWLEKIFFQADE